jgi:hypothetical protein
MCPHTLLLNVPVPNRASQRPSPACLIWSTNAWTPGSDEPPPLTSARAFAFQTSSPLGASSPPPPRHAPRRAEISTVVQFFSFFFGSFPAQNTTKSQVWSRASTHSVLARGGGGFAGAAGHFLRPQMYGVSICCFISRFDYLITVTVTSRP